MADTMYDRVSAINSGGAVTSINEDVTTPMPPVPGVPMSVSAMPNSDTEITVSWMAPDDMGASADHRLHGAPGLHDVRRHDVAVDDTSPQRHGA